VIEDGRIVGGEGWQDKVHNREEWKKLLRTARDRRILHMPMELINTVKSGHENMSDTFPAQNGLKLGDASSPLPDFTFEYAIRKEQVNQNGLKLNRTHQLLVYTDDINLQDLYQNVINKSKEPLLAASKELVQK